MKRACLKKIVGYRFMKVLAVSIAVMAGIGVCILFVSWTERLGRKEHLRQKECWKTAYSIFENSSAEKRDWIKQTIANRESIFDGADYCSALDFIKNGKEGE